MTALRTALHIPFRLARGLRPGRRGGALAAAVALVAVVSGAARPVAAEPSAAAGVGRPAADPMAALTFLLGDYRCAWTDLTVQPPTTSVLTWSTRTVLGGRNRPGAGTGHGTGTGKAAYQEMRLTGDGFAGRWVFGWNSVDAEYFSYYYDDAGTIGHSTSPGWAADGHLRFAGPYSGYGADILSQDDITVVDARHFTDHASVRADESGPWQPFADVACARK
ncbi:DUF1579 domain-containing protein [Streptomyces sp. SID2888]|uniref:DUF1579 domain-containing protein n=1 Tax=Streptomyces sp. SID2888 TaxID=2690256 RepID=UPI001370AB04|nr:DUF1579 domain-containing protein [Streptomyces sp. SID2888]MYV48431.1 hypothetical protein [Streptomyces sp. SID2888]